MANLWADFLTHRGWMAHKWTHYFPAYEQHFSRYVDRPVVFWEIGIGEGGSLQLWKQFLGPYAQIVGLDILDRSVRVTSPIPRYCKVFWMSSDRPTWFSTTGATS